MTLIGTDFEDQWEFLRTCQEKLFTFEELSTELYLIDASIIIPIINFTLIRMNSVQLR